MAVLFFIIATLASIAGAISGIGGGIIIKPLIDATNLFSPAVVNFLSGNTVLAMTCVAIIRSRIKRDSTLIWAKALPMGIGSAIGGVGGGLLFQTILMRAHQSGGVKLIQTICLFVMTLFVLLYVLHPPKKTHQIQNVFAISGVGLLLGLISAFLGIGGGPLNIAFLSYFFSLEAKSATLYSLFIIFCAQCFNLGQTIIQGQVPPISWTFVVLMCLGGIIGSILGRQISHKLNDQQTRHFFVIFLILILGIICYNGISSSI